MNQYEKVRGLRDGDLIEQFTKGLPPGLYGRVYGVPYNRAGRRVLIVDETGYVYHDTHEHTNDANARADLDDWINRMIRVFRGMTIIPELPYLDDPLTRTPPCLITPHARAV